jgi:hypothetical protein
MGRLVDKRAGVELRRALHLLVPSQEFGSTCQVGKDLRAERFKEGVLVPSDLVEL